MTAAEPPPLVLRPLDTFDELEAAVALQKQVWGAAFDNVTSAPMMRVARQLGGLAAGAFAGDGTLAGAVFGLTGPQGGRLVHWSYFLAVAPGWQDRGVGRRLKLFQRDRMLEAGVTEVRWTFDPLEARNAHFNLNRLGVYADAYARDYYGGGEASPLHRGLGTDRLVVSWQLTGARVELALRGRLPRVSPRIDAAPVANPGGDDAGLPEAPLVRVEVPADVQALKAAALPEAVRWRASTRRAFEHYLGRDYAVAGFYRDAESRCFYWLVRAAEGER